MSIDSLRELTPLVQVLADKDGNLILLTAKTLPPDLKSDIGKMVEDAVSNPVSEVQYERRGSKMDD